YLLLFGLLLIGINNNHTTAQELDTSTVIKKIEYRKNGLVEVEYTLPVWKYASEKALISPHKIVWNKRLNLRDCCFGYPDNCTISVPTEVPAQYKTVKTIDLARPLLWKETPILMPEAYMRKNIVFSCDISPNPAETQLRLALTPEHTAQHLYITNFQGAVVYEQDIDMHEQLFWIDVSYFPAGMYAIWLTDAQRHLLKDTDNTFVKR
ncbi:MAG TPA: T9SS type A sorting domain-containing protein, partial [Chitinophagales bacterium]|nr:T9SS type A sorting domain-containing protein [Chitinophagales bacterium]